MTVAPLAISQGSDVYGHNAEHNEIKPAASGGRRSRAEACPGAKRPCYPVLLYVSTILAI